MRNLAFGLLTAIGPFLIGMGLGHKFGRESVSLCSFERLNTDCGGRPCKSWRPCDEVKP